MFLKLLVASIRSLFLIGCTCPAVWWFRVRHLQIVLISMLTSLTAMARNIEIILVVMSSEFIRTGHHWTRMQQLAIQSSYLCGCAAMNFGSGFCIAGLDKKIFVCGIYLAVSFLLVLTPTFVRFGGFALLIVTRLTIGCLMGSVLPVLHWFIFRWSIRKEIVMGYAMAFSGSYMGQFLSLILILSTYHHKFYWDLNFYFFAIYGVCTVITWMLLGSKNPNECPYISYKERELMNKKGLTVSEEIGETIPWKKMVRNVPLIVLIVVECCYRMLYWTMLTQAPIYFLEVYDYPIWKTGLVSALPHLIIWISCYPVGYMVGLFIRANIVHATAARKFCNALALLVGGISMIFMGIFYSLLGSVTMYTASITLGMYYLMGGHINHLDLSPRYAILLLGIIRGAGNISAILSNILTSVIVTDLSSQDQWTLLFRIIGSINVIGGLIYIVFGVAEKQGFDRLPPPSILKKSEAPVNKPFRTLDRSRRGKSNPTTQPRYERQGRADNVPPSKGFRRDETKNNESHIPPSTARDETIEANEKEVHLSLTTTPVEDETNGEEIPLPTSTALGKNEEPKEQTYFSRSSTLEVGEAQEIEDQIPPLATPRDENSKERNSRRES